MYAWVGVLFLWLAYNNRGYFRLISTHNYWLCLPLFLLSLLTVVLRTQVNVLTFSRSTDALSFSHGLLLSVVNTVGNYLPFSFGLIAKGVWLRRFHQMTYYEFTIISLKTFAISLSVSGLVGLLVLLMTDQRNQFLIAGFCFLTALFPLVYFDSTKHFAFLKRNDFIAKMMAPAPLTTKVIAQVGLTYIVFYLITGLRLFIALRMLDIDVSYLVGLLLSCASMVTRLVSLTPANVGLLEGFLGGIAVLIGMDFQLTALAVGVERIFDIFVNFSLFYIFVRGDKIVPSDNTV